MSDSHNALLDALLQVPDLDSRAMRDARIVELSERLNRDLVFPRSDDPRDDLAALLGAFTGAPADLRAFGEIIVLRHQGAAAARFAELTVTRPRPVRAHAYRPEDRIIGDIPIRNRNFTGRVELLELLGAALDQGTTTSVLPPALNGMGGVGKTQLVTEYVHRHLDQYDLIWWIPAEETPTVLAALTQLAQRLDLPVSEDQQDTAKTVLNWLAEQRDDREWLLVYDNADDPASLTPLLPSTGGHVIVTTRNGEWNRVGIAIEVDVFQRHESVQLLVKRSTDQDGAALIAEPEANDLADRLGDLPLALEQAAAWLVATSMSVPEYVELLEVRRLELLREGQPPGYPLTVATMVAVSIDKLRGSDEAIVQLFSLFAFLGGDGIRLSLLHRGNQAELSPQLKTALGSPIRTGQLVRELRRYGLAKTVSRAASSSAPASADKSPRLQVHRLVQWVLRDTLDTEQREQTLRNVQNLLAAASPGDPDEIGELDLQGEMGPHLTPADMIHAPTAQGRQTVLDHARFLFLTGDYENSRNLAERAAAAWAKATGQESLGPDGLSTLLALAQVANATRQLGDSSTAATLLSDVYDRFLASDQLGPEHEYTLITGNQRGFDLRIDGRYQEAFDFDQRSVQAHRRIWGEGEVYTLRAMSNLAVDYRLIGDFAAALRLDEEIASYYADTGAIHIDVYRINMNVVRDYYGIGHYRAALAHLETWLKVQARLVDPRHPLVLMAERTHAIILRKLGLLDDAAATLREVRGRTVRRLPVTHEYSVAATMSLANALREVRQFDEAAALLGEARAQYGAHFGADHPLTLAAEVNYAVLLRATGDAEQATTVDESAFQRLGERLGARHPHTICAGTSLATDHALAGRVPQALALSKRMVELSRAHDASGAPARGGVGHPYVLMRTVNLAHDLRAAGEEDRAAQLFGESLAALTSLLGADHPEVVLAAAGRRLEGDIEPPPT